MLYNRYIARPGLTAIAAVLALSATPLAAQEVDTVVESPPAETTTAVETPAPAASDPLAPVESEPAATKAAPAAKSAPAKSSTPRVKAKPAATARASAPAAAAPAALAASAPVATAPADTAAANPVPPVPVEQLAANAMTPDVAAPETPDSFAVDLDQALPIAGAAGLALVGFAGLGLAMRRRRRRVHNLEEQDMSYRDWHEWHEHEPSIARAEPVADPLPAPAQPQAVRATTVAAPAATFAGASAFGWGNKASTADTPMTTPAATNESRMEAAYRGPTPDNPFLSLKKRLRRAAFFDQRDRAVSEGLATPISPMAGLPKALNGNASTTMRSGTVQARPQLAPA